MIVVRYASRPELKERRKLAASVFPEFTSHHGLERLWGRLYTEFAPFQLALLEGDADEIVAEVHSLALPWDGTLDDLPAGWAAAFELGMEHDSRPTVLCLLAIAVSPDRRGEGLGERMLQEARAAAREAGLGAVIAPVRPTLKERYPLIPIEEYVTWRRDDGSHFDPWIRLHERVGGQILKAAPESMTVVGPVADWETWTGMAFPADGAYTVPGMLSTLTVENGVGRHVEPNVWMAHLSADPA